MKIKGLNSVLKNLKNFGKEAEVEVEIITREVAKEISANAKVLAPKNIGKLSQSIGSHKIAESDYEIVVGLEYGVYVEFGTGAKVSVPSELQSMASKFKGKGGSFEEGLRAIKDWCRSKGIEENAAYPIFISILNKGITPQPYLYPAWVKGKQQYLDDLKAELKRLTKKYE